MIKLENESKTTALAEALASVAKNGDVIGLSGNLGVGKSSFARAFINARCGIDEVPSPTFTLVQTYEETSIDNEIKNDIWHLDLYRINDESEVYELGLYEALGQDIILIEWPERVSAKTLGDWLNITLDFSEEAEERIVTFIEHGSRSKTLRDYVLSQIKML